MPWHVSDGPDNRCPTDKPWAVILDRDGSAVQCHISKEAAEKAIVALNINVHKGEKVTMHKMVVNAEFKALTGDDVAPGTFSALVAVYGNVDRMGDRILEGAFDDTLAEWQKKGDPIPLILAHEWNNPFAHIGYAMPDKVKSVPGVGLVVEEGHLDVGDNPMAAQVYRLMERKSLAQFSFGYTIPKGGGRKAMDGAFDLAKLNLVEIGPCLRGVNDQTQLLSIKSELEARERGMSIEERIARLEAEVEMKADGPPVQAYDPQKAKASMLITANAFVTKVQEQAAIDAMNVVISDIGKVPGATPKPEYAGNKADIPAAHASPAPGETTTGSGSGYDSGQVMQQMMTLAQQFIANEDDPQDVANMQAVADAIQLMMQAEQGEPAEVEGTTNAAPAPGKMSEEIEAKAAEVFPPEPVEKPVIDKIEIVEAKAEPDKVDSETLDRQLRSMHLEQELRSRENDTVMKEILAGGKADETMRHLQELEDWMKKD